MVLETAAVASLAYSAYAGYEQHEEQQASLKRQKQAQDKAMSDAASARRSAEMAQRQANLEGPDLDRILDEQRKRALSGPASTMLTGPGGVDPGTLRLGGGVSLLGVQ